MVLVKNFSVSELQNIMFRCSSKFTWLSKITPRCFWQAVCLTFVFLKLSGMWNGFLILQEKITSCACLVGSRLKLIFHLVVQSLIFSKSSLRLFAEVFKLWTSEKRDMSSANNSGLYKRYFDNSLMWSFMRGFLINP